MIHIIPPLRKHDKWGAGYYGAPRGGRKHRGVDVETPAGSVILSPVHGEITKFGYPYSDDLSFRYVEITNMDDLKFRFFYVKPLSTLTTGDTIRIGEPIGTSQSLDERYKDITPHIHCEIKDQEGIYYDPNDFY